MEKAKHIAYLKTPAVQYDSAEFEADHFDLADYCLIPYMARPILNTTKELYAPVSGSRLPDGDIAF
ncbi:hypothetical protein D3C81_2094470 [compost metagenome]